MRSKCMDTQWNKTDPEVQSVADLVEYLFDDGKETFTTQMLVLVSANTKKTTKIVRQELESYGLILAARTPAKEIRGFSSWDNNRWAGNPGKGGSGWEQVAGFAGKVG